MRSSLSTAQLLAIAIIVLITAFQQLRRAVGQADPERFFTVAKLGGMAALLGLGAVVAFLHPAVLRANFAAPWHPVNVTQFTVSRRPPLWIVSLPCAFPDRVALLPADSWHDITFVAAEVRNPKRNLPLALAIGTSS